MCFIGHGAFGIITKPIWCNYFALFGIGHDTAYRLMPLLGAFDIMMGIGMLIYPMRVIPLWLVIWGAFTAFLRPLSGEPVAEFIERAGNFGAPLALLFLSGSAGKNLSDFFLPVNPQADMDKKTFYRVTAGLKIFAFLLLAGHGWLNLLEKKSLLGQYTLVGFTNAGKTAMIIGAFEILAALAVLIRPVRPMILGLFIWKMGSELFYPQHEPFEWIERGGSYGVLLALWFALDLKNPSWLSKAKRSGMPQCSTSRPSAILAMSITST
jgi:hypothetical protein